MDKREISDLDKTNKVHAVQTPDAPLVSVIKASYNAPKDVCKLISSVKANNYSNCEIIVVDNHSTLIPPQLILAHHPDLKLILSDKNLSSERLPMPMLLCVGAINTFLIQKKLRGYVSINVQSGEAIDTHSFATLIGVGATTVNPYLAFDSLYQRYEKKLFGQFSFDECVQRYINSVNAGLLKIMSKMGISVLSSYRGGCNFETVGLSRTVVNEYFPGVTSKISGIGLVGIEKKIREIHKEAFESTETILPIGGIYRYRKNGETHQYQGCLLYTSPSPRDVEESRMPSSA